MSLLSLNWIPLILSLVFFSILVLRIKLFRVEGTRPQLFLFLFFAKLAAGFALYWVYSRHYTDRSGSDIYRYFDDASVLFSSLKTSPGDFFRMLSGIGADDPSLQKYYEQMNNWNLGKMYNFYNDNRSITRFNAFVMLFSCGNYHVHTVVMCFLSLCGLTALYRFFVLFTGPNGWIFSGVFFLPSVMFWSSGVLKEGLLLFFMGLMLWYAGRWIFGERRWSIIPVFMLCLAAMLCIKIYVLLCIVPALIALLWTGTKGRGAIWKYPLVYLCCIAAGYFGLKEYTKMDPVLIITEKQNDFWLLARGGDYVVDIETKDTIYIPLQGKENVMFHRDPRGMLFFPSPVQGYYWKNKQEAQPISCGPERRFTQILHLTYAGSRMNTERMKPAWTDLIKRIPMAVVNVIFRPFPWEWFGSLSLPAILENLLLLGFIGFSLLSRRERLSKPGINNLFLFCLVFTLGLSIIIGITTPVLGAVVRYKVPLLPFLFCMFALVLLYGKNVIRNKM